MRWASAICWWSTALIRAVSGFAWERSCASGCSCPGAGASASLVSRPTSPTACVSEGELDAHRRSRRAPWDADAVLTIRGRVEHAESPEAQLRESRSALRDAAAAVDRARGKLRRIDPDSALGQWMGLVDGRWSLVDKFDTDGKRYVLARRNEPRVGGLGLLTERERAVAFYAAMGRSNKHIAYDLGIAHSTVRVLLARAAAKLGVKTRDELVAIAQGAVAEGK